MLVLDWIDTLGLPVAHAEDSGEVGGILHLLPAPSRRTIILELVSALSPTTTTAANRAQLSTLLGLLGHGLTLSLEDIPTMTKILDLYREWIDHDHGDGDGGVGGERLVGEVVRQVSLLFRVRTVEGASGKTSVASILLAKHCDLCRTALTLLTSISSTQSLSLPLSTTLLMTILGIADSLLRLPLLPPCYLADELTSPVLSALHQIWIRAGSMSEGGWGRLRDLHRRWCHRLPVIKQWCAITAALTQRIAAHLYTATGPSGSFSLLVDGQQVSFESSKVFEMFAWRQYLKLLPNPNEIPPANCLCALDGISHILALLTNNGSTAGYGGPDADTLLSLFGRFLFDCVALGSMEEYVQVSIRSLALLSPILLLPAHRRPMSLSNLHQSYHALSTSLSHPNLHIAIAALSPTTALLEHGRLPGIRVLLPPILRAARRLVPRTEPCQPPVQLSEDFRRTCYKLITILAVYSSHYGDIHTFDAVPDSSVYSAHLPISSPFLRASVDTLLSALLAETDQPNQRYLLNLLTTLVLDIGGDQSLAPLYARILSDHLSSSSKSTQSTQSTMIVAIQSLEALITLPIPSETISSAIIPALVQVSQSTQSAALREKGLDALVKWASAAPSASLSSPTNLASLMATLDQPSLARLIALLGPPLSSSACSVPSACPTELDLLSPGQEPKYFLLNKSVLACFIESKDHQQLYLLLRSQTGRYAWIARPLYKQSDNEPNADITGAFWKEFSNLTIKPPVEPFIPDEDTSPVFNDALFNKQIEQDPRRLNNLHLLQQLYKEQMEAMEKERVLHSPAHTSAPHTPASPPSQQGKLARLLLAQFGFLSPASNWFIQSIPNSPALSDHIRALDSLPERHQISVSVFFVRSGLQSLAEILVDPRITTEFLQFAHSLGFPVKNKVQAVHQSAPFYADDHVQLAYHVVPLLPRPVECKDDFELASHVGSIISEDHVAIIWMESEEEFISLPSKFGLPQTYIYICIIPLSDQGTDDGLYRIRIMATSTICSIQSDFSFGPVQEGIILRRASLGPIIRAASISASLYCRKACSPDSPSPVEARARFILEMAKSYQDEAGDAFQHFYSQLLLEAPTL